MSTQLLRSLQGAETIRCGGADRLTLVALIRDAAVVGRILRHLGLPDEVPVPGSGRAPPLPWEADGEAECAAEG